MAQNPAPKKLFPVLAPAEVAEAMSGRRDVRLLDVRTPGEFAVAHIAGAYNVPLDTLAEHAAEIRAAVNGTLILVCQSGQRARRAEDALARAGMAQLHVLDGGMNGWIAADLPVRRGPIKKISLERQVRMAAGTLAAAGGLLAVLVDPAFGLLSAVVGSGLVFAGVTDTCAMGLLMAKLPYNRSASCDVGAAVRALAEDRTRNAEGVEA
jgi:rhodanese-related sulfurtransferase